ncbi:septation protein SepH [Pedococcus sp. 2YAF34]|uniref:septation protein SepH n=1 Tax=Pedococcus sp. 2YAF34 TaxID=3233032 RepID=UPI003F9A3343
MRDLRLIGVHEDGQRLLLSDAEGEQYGVPLDEPLRAAVRRDRPRLGQLQIEIDGGLRPRDVQAMIRAGLSAEEVADRSGWAVEKVRRYEGPILAEREYVAGLARAVRLRGRAGAGSTTPTLAARVSTRLSGRGVDPALAEWDSARSESGEWTVVVTFPAGGRERQARWQFDVQARTVTASDDEARWLSEEDTAGGASPLPTPHLVSTPVRATTVYDVEAEGGVQATTPRRPAPLRGEEPLDLMSAMRERASHRGRPRRRKGPASQTPVDEAPREDALPLEDLAYDPETMPPPPAARGPHPLDPTPGTGSVGDDVLPAAPTPAADQPSAPTADAEQPERTEEAAALVVDDLADDLRDDLTDDVVVLDVEDHDVEEHSAADADLDDAARADVVPEDVADAGSQEPEDLDDVAVEDVEPEPEPATEPEPVDEAPAAPARPRPAKKSGRRSVPSWDDVMFGAKPRD